MTATQKQVKRALYNGLPNLSDRELRQMIDRELEKDSSQKAFHRECLLLLSDGVPGTPSAAEDL